MKLSEFQKVGKGDSARLVATIADVTGAKDYEFTVAGPAAAIKKVFPKSDFSVTIDPRRTADRAEKELQQETRQRLEEFAQAAKLDDVARLPIFKKAPVAPANDKTVFVSLRRVRGEGTFWGPWRFPYFLPRGFNIFVIPPPLCTLTASVTPASGDQDIFLTGGFFLATPIMSSVRGGTAVDTVFFSNPPLTPCNIFTWNVLMIRILGFTTGAGTFMLRGFS